MLWPVVDKGLCTAMHGEAGAWHLESLKHELPQALEPALLRQMAALPVTDMGLGSEGTAAARAKAPHGTGCCP